MINKKMMTSLLIGAATLIGTALPTPALANNNNAALNMMAMQMYMQQQANAQQQTILAQQQANANYAAAQAAWAANTVQPTTQTVVSYAPAQYYAPAPQVVYNNFHPQNHDFHRDNGIHNEGRRR